MGTTVQTKPVSRSTKGTEEKLVFSLPPLPYAFDALEPHIDARTMEIHHGKHHAGYVDGLNKAVSGRDLGQPSVEELLAAIGTLPEEIRAPVRNMGGGHANHSLFWTILSPKGGGEPKADLAQALDRELGGFAHFRESITKAALGRFGSGWAWLSVEPTGKLVVESTPNQDSPRMHGNTPILGIDLWEHAYYLKYQNRRADYVQAIFNVFDWDAVGQRYFQTLRQVRGKK
ncbi:MAG: superoxide dismutase [Pirellulales bacterium]|nr:superoxide dismutase [Pirellulales bacterium]